MWSPTCRSEVIGHGNQSAVGQRTTRSALKKTKRSKLN
jgi:hypothetical protein